MLSGVVERRTPRQCQRRDNAIASAALCCHAYSIYRPVIVACYAVRVSRLFLVKEIPELHSSLCTGCGLGGDVM